MTVNTKKITSGPYTGNGVADTFSYTFKVNDKTELSVYETDDIGVQIELIVDTDYTVNTVGNDSGGTITRVAGALPTNYEWYIRSNYDETQLTAFTSQGAFFPDLHENAMDKLTFLIQQLLDKISRTFSLSDSYSGPLPLTLENPDGGKVLQWNEDKTGIINFDVITPLSSLDSRVSDTEGRLDSAEGRLDTVEDKLDEADGTYVRKQGDVMTGGLDVVDSPSSSSAVPKVTIANAIDNAINAAIGVLPDGTPKDYGFINEPVDEIFDYGSVA
jgi:hypothetical protein